MSFSEETIVDLIRESFANCVAPGARGLLDDGAWLPQVAPLFTRVISCDAFQEGNDFLVQIAPVETAGCRAVVQNLSDLAAMGARPVGFVWSLEVPVSWLKNNGKLLTRFCNGAAKACEESRLLFYGGDLSFASDKFSCTITVLGDVAGQPLSRQGAVAGDVIYVSRPLGLSSFGLNILLKKLQSRSKSMKVERFSQFANKLNEAERLAVLTHLGPKAEIDLAQELVGVATSCMDISDGLASDLHRLCKASEVGAALDCLPAAFHPLLPVKKARECALFGGEEFALLFTAKPDAIVNSRCIRIGTTTSEVGAIFEMQGRRQKRIKPLGYDHFTSRV